MKFRPLHDRVVVKRIEAEQKSGGRDESGKLIPIDVKQCSSTITALLPMHRRPRRCVPPLRAAVWRPSFL